MIADNSLYGSLSLLASLTGYKQKLFFALHALPLLCGQSLDKYKNDFCHSKRKKNKIAVIPIQPLVTCTNNTYFNQRQHQ